MTTTTETFSSGSLTVPLEVWLPAAASGRCPVVLVLHGSFGLEPPYRQDMLSFAQALAARGVAAALPRYLEATGTPAGFGVFAVIPSLRPVWRQVCSDALAALAHDARFDATRLGLLGFSLGANLALSLAVDPPAGTSPRCVVDFFGPTQGLPAQWAALPPALILHGSADEIVLPGESAQLMTQWEADGKKKGRDYGFSPYPGEGHGFKGAALVKSRDETVEFILKHL